MKLTTIINSSFIGGLGIFLSKTVPPFLAYRISDLLAEFISTQKKMDIVNAVRLNQWVVHDFQLTSSELNRKVHRVFKYHLRCMYDLYHNIYRYDRIRKKVVFCPELKALLQLQKQAGQGLLIAVPHLGSIDMAGIALALGGVKFSIISYPQPPSGYRLHNKIRQDVGIEVLPSTFNNLRTAGERLQEGGIVITGVDRPMMDSNYVPNFFGHPAKVPITPVRLALKHNAIVAVCACISDLKGNYQITATEPLPMQRNPNLNRELTGNTEVILQEVEQLVRKHPEQWNMFYPVWPDLSGTMP